MESKTLLENLCPGEILILYEEDNSYVYAINKNGGLIIERAFVPDTQVNLVREYKCKGPDIFDLFNFSIANAEQLDETAKAIGLALRKREEELKKKRPH